MRLIRSHPRRAIMLIDLMVTLTLMAVVFAMVLPAMSDDTMTRLRVAARMLRADIQLAQMASVANPENPVQVQFTDCTGGCDGYRLQHLSGGKVSVNGVDEDIFFGVGRAVATGPVNATLTPQDRLDFNGLGGLSSPAFNPTIVLSLNGRSITLVVSTTTGTVNSSEN